MTSLIAVLSDIVYAQFITREKHSNEIPTHITI